MNKEAEQAELNSRTSKAKLPETATHQGTQLRERTAKMPL